jgi:hypothetical protein
MPATAPSPPLSFHIAEEGEAIGTIQQFANRLHLSPSAVLACLREAGTAPIVLRAGEAGERLLLVSADGLDALRSCAVDRACS